MQGAAPGVRAQACSSPFPNPANVSASVVAQSMSASTVDQLVHGGR